MNRREFEKAVVGASVGALLGGREAAALQGNVAGAGTLPAPRDAVNRFSVMLWTLPRALTFVQRLEIAAGAGYGAVEVLNEYVTWTPEEWTRNLARMRALGIVVDSAVPGRNALADHTKRTALRDDLLKAVPGAKELGCRQFIYTAYTRVPGQTAEEQRAAVADSLKYAADVVEKEGMEILLEPIDLLEHKDEAVTSVVEASAITRAVGSARVKVLYDFFHEQRQAGNLIETLEKNFDQVGLVHVADVPGRHQPGTGEINYGNIYRKLAALRYDRYVCMEFMAVGDPVTVLKAARVEAAAAMQAG